MVNFDITKYDDCETFSVAPDSCTCLLTCFLRTRKKEKNHYTRPAVRSDPFPADTVPPARRYVPDVYFERVHSFTNTAAAAALLRVSVGFIRSTRIDPLGQAIVTRRINGSVCFFFHFYLHTTRSYIKS